MNMHGIRNILTAAENFGGTIPAQINGVFANWNAACDAADNLRPEPLAVQLANATTKNVAKVIETAATRAIIADRARDMVRETEGHLVNQIVQALRGGAGTELVESIRPAFDRAAQAISDAPFTPDTATQPTRIISLGDDAVQAWRELPAHAAALDAIYRNVIMPLVHQVDLLPEPDASHSRPGMRFIAMVIDGDHNADIARAAGVFGGALGTGEPGMGWHRLSTSGFKLKLNTPAEATELIEQWNESVAEQQRNREAKAAEATAALREAVATR